MSWGERSCQYFGENCPTTPTLEKCNVDCIYYEPNGKEPDSVSRKRQRKAPMQFVPPTAEIDPQLQKYIEVLCQEGPQLQIRAGWDLEYRRRIQKCLRN